MTSKKERKIFLIGTLLLLVVFALGYLGFNQFVFAEVSGSVDSIDRLISEVPEYDELQTEYVEAEPEEAMITEEEAIVLAAGALYEKFVLTMDGLEMEVYLFADGNELFADYNMTLPQWYLDGDHWLIFTNGFEEYDAIPQIDGVLRPTAPVFKMRSILVDESNITPEWHFVGDYWLILMDGFEEYDDMIFPTSTKFYIYVDAATGEVMEVVDRWCFDSSRFNATFNDITWTFTSWWVDLLDFIPSYMITHIDAAVLAAEFVYEEFGVTMYSVEDMSIDLQISPRAGELYWHVHVIANSVHIGGGDRIEGFHLAINAITGEIRQVDENDYIFERPIPELFGRAIFPIIEADEVTHNGITWTIGTSSTWSYKQPYMLSQTETAVLAADIIYETFDVTMDTTFGAVGLEMEVNLIARENLNNSGTLDYFWTAFITDSFRGRDYMMVYIIFDAVTGEIVDFFDLINDENAWYYSQQW